MQNDVKGLRMQRYIYTVCIGFVLSLFPVRFSLSETKRRTSSPKKVPSTNRHIILSYALTHNFSLRRFKAQLKGATAKVRGSFIFPNNPNIFASGGGQFPLSSPTSSSRSMVLPRIVGGVSLRLPIGGRWRKSQLAALSQMTSLKWQQRLKEYHLSLSVHRLLNDVAIALQKQRTHRLMVSFFRKIRIFIQKRLQYGVATEFDVQFAKNALLQAKQKFLSSQLHYRLQVQTLKTLIGWTSLQKLPWNLSSIPRLNQLPKKIIFIRKALRKHVWLRLAKAKIAQSKSALELSQSRAVPDLTLSLFYALEDNSHVIRGGISIPLPLFWRNQSKIGQHYARFQSSKISLMQQRFLIRQRILSSYTKYRTSLDALLLFKKRNHTVQTYVEQAQKGLQQGGLSVFQVLTAQRQLLENQLSYVDNIQKAHHHYIQLCQATGILPIYKGTFSFGEKEQTND